MARGKKKEILTPEERLQAALVPESEQPYKVPGNWCWVRLELLLRSSKEKTEEFSDADLKYVGLEHMQKDGGIVAYDSAERVKSLKNVFHPQQILYGKLRPYLNKHDIATFDGVCSTDILVFNATSVTIPKFVNFFLDQDTFIEYAVSNSKGINLPRVSESVVLDAKCPLPPIYEQHRIVDRIESLFAKLDEAKQKAQDALDSFETRKAAILHRAFTGELTSQWRKEHGVGMESWRTVTFKDACLKITDGTHHSPVNTPTGEYMYVTAKNIKETGIDLTNITFVSKDVHDEIYSRCDVQYGDVLYIKDGATTGIATVNTIEEPFSLLSSVAVLRPDKKQIMAEYMVYNLNSSKTKAMMINNMSGNAITRLTLSKIKTAPITVCSLDEQAEIVRILDDLLAKEQQAKEAAEGVLEQIDLIKKAILARAFRGELGTNDPSEESAVELLKQISSC